MLLKNVWFCIPLSLLLVAVGAAQEEPVKPAPPKPDKAAQRLIDSLTKQMVKKLAAAKLTEEQEKAIPAIVEKHVDDLKSAQQTVNSLVSKEQKKKQREAMKQAKKDGKKGKAVKEAGNQALGLSEADLKKYLDATEKMNATKKTILKEIVATLTDEQKALVGQKEKKGKKGGKKGNKKGKKGQEVSLLLPAITSPQDVKLVRKTLKGIAGIKKIKSDPQTHTCTFVVPNDCDVKATLDKLVQDGNELIKGWSFAKPPANKADEKGASPDNASPQSP